MTLNEFLSTLDRVQENGGQYRANCPACGDRGQHLYVKEEDGKILLDCKKGCQFTDIVSALGLKQQDMFTESRPMKKQWTILREHIYHNENGGIIGKKRICDKGGGDKTAVWFRYVNGNYTKGLSGMKMPLFNLHKLVNTPVDTAIIVTEGEKDAETCERMGFVAVSSPNGAGAKWSKAYTPFFKGRKVCILADNDDAGDRHGIEVANALAGTASQVKLVRSAEIYPQVKQKGDISDIVTEVGLNEAKSLLTEAVRHTADHQVQPVPIEEKSVPDFIIVNENELTGKITYKVSCPLLADHFRDRQHYFWLHSHGGKPLRYIYRNGVYVCISDDELKGTIKNYITDFMPALLKMRDVEEVYKNLCCDGVFKSVDELNADENIINFKNGVLKLDTMKLVPHSPDYLCTTQIACNWNDNAGASPVFDGYMKTLTGGNSEVRKLLIEFMGAVISNAYGYRFKSALFMVGAGNTGKSQLKALTERLIGKENSAAVNIRDLEERFGTSKLYGKRLIGSADMSFMTVKELKTFKNITGGDSIAVEFKNRDSFSYVYKGLIWYCTNQLPKFGGDRGDHVYDRIITVRCDNVVPAEKRDGHITDKMYAEGESIVRQAVLAFREIMDRGSFTVPEVCRQEKENYRVDNSPVLSFFKECCVDRVTAVDNCTRSMMYRIFKEWCKDNNCYAPNQALFRQEIASFKQCDISELEKVVQGKKFYKFTLSKDTKEQYAYIYGNDNSANHTGYHH